MWGQISTGGEKVHHLWRPNVCAGGASDDKEFHQFQPHLAGHRVLEWISGSSVKVNCLACISAMRQFPGAPEVILQAPWKGQNLLLCILWGG